MTRIWLFGEAEYETTETFEQNFKRLFKVSEACGYMIGQTHEKTHERILLEGTDLDVIKIVFARGSLCNLLIISINQTTQDGSKLAGKWRQVLAAATDSSGKITKVLEEEPLL